MAKDLFVVENMVEIPLESHMTKHDSDNIIVFLGKMDYDPNVVAVRYFANDIFPKLKEKFQDLEFYIVGINPCGEVLDLSKKDGIIVTGYVDSLEEYFHKATIVVAPMLTGAGIQNKIIQAMSYGCCVVTTHVGAEGLHIHKDEIGKYEDTDSMIKGIEKLLINRDLRIEMGKKAREYVLANLSPDIIEKQFWEFMG